MISSLNSPPRKRDLCQELQRKNLNLPPDNIHLFCGNSLETSTYERISEETGVNFSDIDLFYTYITLHDLFAEKIARDAKSGASVATLSGQKKPVLAVAFRPDSLEVASGGEDASVRLWDPRSGFQCADHRPCLKLTDRRRQVS